jgi:hypothetical protein
MRSVNATRYVTALREGGSLPGLIEADDDGTYVVKFTGAGQGPPVLATEVIAAAIATRIGLRVPELVLIDVDVEIGRREPDPEIQDLLVASAGVNLGSDFLPGSFGYDGLTWTPPAAEAARVLWLDALIGNVDRSWRNPNLLVWHRTLWCIDHGASMLFQHSWPTVPTWAARRYDIAEHVMAAFTPDLADVGDELDSRVDDGVLAQALASVPETWLAGSRERYFEYLAARLAQHPWRAL